MNKIELEKMFDEKFGELYHLIDGEEYGWKEILMGNEVKKFIFEHIIPEVLKGVIGNKKQSFVYNGQIIKDINGDVEFFGINNISKRAKELYNINL